MNCLLIYPPKLLRNPIHFKEKYKDGVSYSSCYLPIGTVDIRFSDHNIVLYEQGISKIKFNRSEIKINDKKYSGVKLVKLLIDSTK